MIAITFALSDESKDFSRLLRDAESLGPHGFPALPCQGGAREVLLFHTGMGANRTRERLRQLWDDHPSVECVISAGYAGALDPVLSAGAIILAENYSNPERLAAAEAILEGRAHIGKLATCDTALETCQGKTQLAKATGAIAVDMETSTIAELCRERGVPLLSIRVISDTAHEELAVPFSVCFDARTERPRVGALLAFLLCHPVRIPAFIRFVRTVNRARRLLAEALWKVASGK